MRIDGTVLRLSTDELVRLAPRLRPYLTTPQPAWPAIVDAADWLRGELGVSKSLWGEACLAMGREEAAIAVAIVSAKPAGHFRSVAGRVFPRDGGEGEGRGAEPGADHLGVAEPRPAGRRGAPAPPGELMPASESRPTAYAVVKARQAARPVASRTMPAATSCRSRPRAACGEIARWSARPRAVTTGVRST